MLQWKAQTAAEGGFSVVFSSHGHGASVCYSQAWSYYQQSDKSVDDMMYSLEQEAPSRMKKGWATMEIEGYGIGNKRWQEEGNPEVLYNNDFQLGTWMEDKKLAVLHITYKWVLISV